MWGVKWHPTIFLIQLFFFKKPIKLFSIHMSDIKLLFRLWSSPIQNVQDMRHCNGFSCKHPEVGAAVNEFLFLDVAGSYCGTSMHSKRPNTPSAMKTFGERTSDEVCCLIRTNCSPVMTLMRTSVQRNFSPFLQKFFDYGSS